MMQTFIEEYGFGGFIKGVCEAPDPEEAWTDQEVCPCRDSAKGQARIWIEAYHGFFGPGNP
jgi:hypothetical protein